MGGLWYSLVIVDLLSMHEAVASIPRNEEERRKEKGGEEENGGEKSKREGEKPGLRGGGGARSQGRSNLEEIQVVVVKGTSQWSLFLLLYPTS